MISKSTKTRGVSSIQHVGVLILLRDRKRKREHYKPSIPFTKTTWYQACLASKQCKNLRLLRPCTSSLVVPISGPPTKAQSAPSNIPVTEIQPGSMSRNVNTIFLSNDLLFSMGDEITIGMIPHQSLVLECDTRWKTKEMECIG